MIIKYVKKEFGKLLKNTQKHNAYQYLCRCDCGNYIVVSGYDLTKCDSPVLSCGECKAAK